MHMSLRWLAQTCGKIEWTGQSRFLLTATQWPLRQRSLSSVQFADEILNAFSDRTAPVMDLTFGDGLHSKLLLGNSTVGNSNIQRGYPPPNRYRVLVLLT